MQEVKIRKAKEEDIKSIAEGFRKTYLPLFKSEGLSQDNIDKMYASNDENHMRERIKGNYFFVAEVSDKVVGVIGLKKNDNSDVQNRISTFFVLEDFQGKGVGSLLYNKVFDLTKKLKVNKIVVNSSLLAEKIYKHWGFKKVKFITRKYPDGGTYKNVWMEKIMR